MDLLTIINGLIGLLLAICGYFLREARDDIRGLERALSDFQLKVEREFVSMDTWQKNRDEVRDSLVNIFKEIGEIKILIARVEAKMNGKRLR